jgi:orotidine-5'-phosphate decarboxylase
MTPAEAIRAGVDYIVVGRPILEAKNPLSAARAIVADMEGRREGSSRHSAHESFRPQ